MNNAGGEDTQLLGPRVGPKCKPTALFGAVFVYTLLIFNVSAQKLEFTHSEHDFGRVERAGGRGGKVEHVFEFINGGDEPLVITRVLTGCVCTRVRYDKRPVPAGGRGAITVVYDASKQPLAGEFYKVIEVLSNSEDGRRLLVVKGVVEE